MEKAGQLQPVMPVCGAPQVSMGNFNGAQKTCGLTPVRSSTPQVSLGGYNGTFNNMGTYSVPLSTTGIQLPSNYQTTPLPSVGGSFTPRGGNYSPRVQLQNSPVATPQRDNFFKWFFSF